MQIRIDGWRKGIRFSSAHLTADLGECERLHGHTYALHAVLHGEPAQSRIVYDFSHANRTLKDIAKTLDHYILVPRDGDQYAVKSSKEALVMEFNGKRYEFPRGDCFQLPTPSSTAEDLVQFVRDEFVRRSQLPANVSAVDVGVDEGYGQGAWTSWRREEA